MRFLDPGFRRDDKKEMDPHWSLSRPLIRDGDDNLGAFPVNLAFVSEFG